MGGIVPAVSSIGMKRDWTGYPFFYLKTARAVKNDTARFVGEKDLLLVALSPLDFHPLAPQQCLGFPLRAIRSSPMLLPA
jgi:hypothetical protein